MDRYQKQSITLQKKWRDPTWREKMVKAQEKAGLRAYGSKLNYLRKNDR